MDRIDIHQRLRQVRPELLVHGQGEGESSAAVAERVLMARDRQRNRLGPLGLRSNAEVPGAVLRRHLPMPGGAEAIGRAMARGQISARGVDKVLRLAWTLCDLSGQSRPGADHVRAALAMRQGEESAAVMAHG